MPSSTNVFGMSPAGTDLGLGTLLSEQGQETEEEQRRKRLLLQQQKQQAMSGVAMTPVGAALFGGMGAGGFLR